MPGNYDYGEVRTVSRIHVWRPDRFEQYKDLEVSEATDLVAHPGPGSLEIMAFIEMIEDEFDIFISLKFLPDINIFGQLARKPQDLNS